MSSLDSRWTFIKLLEDGVLDPSFREEVLRYKYRGSSGKVNLALDGLPELACKPGDGRVAPRRDLVLAVDRLHRARLRRREVRAAVGAPLHRLHHADARRPVDGAARQARDELLRAVRAVSPRRRQGVGRRGARVVRAERDRHARGAVPRHPQQDRRAPVRDAQGHRGHHRAHRGQHLPGGAVARAAVLQPAGPGLVALPHAGATSSGCAARPRTRAAASWARPGGSRRSSTSRRRRRAGGRRRWRRRRSTPS